MVGGEGRKEIGLTSLLNFNNTTHQRNNAYFTHKLRERAALTEQR